MSLCILFRFPGRFRVPANAASSLAGETGGDANRFRLQNVVVTTVGGGDGAALPRWWTWIPDQQLVSMIFGLRVALRNAAGQDLMKGDVELAPFSYVWSRGVEDRPVVITTIAGTKSFAPFSCKLTSLLSRLPPAPCGGF